MKAHIVTLFILDIDDIGATEAREVIEYVKYPNRCISPHVQEVVTYEVGEYDDDHPLNQNSTNPIEWLAGQAPHERWQKP